MTQKKTAKKTPRKKTPRKKTPVKKNSEPEEAKEEPKQIVHNEKGRFENIDYKYDEFGFIDWKKTIPEKFLFVNQEWFIHFKKDIPKTIEGLEDHQILIKLAGIKWLAKVYGYKSLDFEVIRSEDYYCVVKCKIEWNCGTVSSELASATDSNCYGFAKNFIETIAANRSFTRCVRNFLNINIVGEEELGPEKEDDDEEVVKDEAPKPKRKPSGNKTIVPQEFFLNQAKDVLGSLESVVSFLKENGIELEQDSEESAILESIDVKVARSLIKKLNDHKKSE